MRKLLAISISIVFGFVLAAIVLVPRPVAIGGGADQCAVKNGDVNADGEVDMSDAISILGNLFLGNPTELAPPCAPTLGLTATGQTACWNFDVNQGLVVEVPCGEAACPGQDGSSARGCPMENRFVDNGDGTVTDTCTGLLWQQDTADVNEDGQIVPLDDALIWCDALAYCENLSFARHNDWRLPNVRELQSIVDYGRFNQAIDPKFGALSEFYWSSTSYADAPDDAWGIGFNVGGVYIRPKLGDFDFSFNYVRAVRGP